MFGVCVMVCGVVCLYVLCEFTLGRALEIKKTLCERRAIQLTAGIDVWGKTVKVGSKNLAASCDLSHLVQDGPLSKGRSRAPKAPGLDCLAFSV